MIALAIAVLVLLAPGTARAQADTIEITTAPGETCRSIAIRVYGDPDAVEILHQHNPGLGPQPHHLAPGTVLRLPPPGPPARLTAIERRVERRDPEAASFAGARAGDELARGTQVRTHEASSAEITFRDRAEVTVREQTLVIVYGGRRRLVSRPVTRAELERGALRSRLGELAGGAPIEIETPSSQASLGGEGVVSVEDDGTSRVANHGDRPATVVAGGARVVVPEGTGVVVRRGERPTRPRRLLAAPRWRADLRGFVLGLAGRGATLRGGFEPVRGAARYRVEVARRADGGDLIAALELGPDATRFEAPEIPEGTVYVSVASIDEAGLEGRRSPWRAFTVRLARLVSPGGAEPDLAAAAPRVLPGTWLVAPRGMGCAIGADASADVVTLRAPGAASISCVDAAGVSEPASIDVEVALPHVVIDGTLTRDRTSTLGLAVSGDPLPPAHALALGAPEGFEVGPLRADGDVLRAEVRAPPGAPERVEVTLDLITGAERIALARVSVPVVDPAAASPIPTSAPAATPRRVDPVVQSALGDLAWPSALALRDERRGGIGAYLTAAAIESPDDPQVRLGGGVRAEIPETPLRLALASQGDVLGSMQPAARRGDLDVVAGLGTRLWDDAVLSIALDATVWFPTRRAPESLGRVRLAPSLEASVLAQSWLSLRARQGALVDAADRGARLWAFAIGADARPIPELAIGVELDGSVGELDERAGAALAIGAGLELRLGGLDLALAARVGLTDEARAFLGTWSVALSTRLVAR